jgi:hypothetical protein
MGGAGICIEEIGGSGVFFHVGRRRYRRGKAVAADMEKDSRPLALVNQHLFSSFGSFVIDSII